MRGDVLAYVTVLETLCPRDTLALGMKLVGVGGIESSDASSCGTGLRAARLTPGPPPEDVRFMGETSCGGLAGITREGESMERRGTVGDLVRGEEDGTGSFPSNFASAIARCDWLELLARERPYEPALGSGSAMGLRPAPDVEAEERRRFA